MKLFEIEPLDVKNFIKVNDLEKITNPIFFDSNNSPTADGLLSNQIFGITKDERSNTFAYISLGKNEIFMHPLMYKTLYRINNKIKTCVHGTKKYIIKNGELVEDEDGECGIKFLAKNFDKIKLREDEDKTSKRSIKIKFINKYRDKIFIENMVVIPAYYRDIDTKGAYVGVGDINKLYNSLILAAKSLDDSYDYGLSLSDSIRGRIQELLVQIYDYFTIGVFNGKPVTGIYKKKGILRNANLSKTTDYSSRVIISAPQLKVENMCDLITDLDYSAVPLATLCVNFFPYMLFYMRRFFENLFSNNEIFNYIDIGDNNTIKKGLIKDYQITFSDERLKEEIDRFVHGIANRFRIIEVPTLNNKIIKLKLTMGHITEEEYAKSTKEDLKNLKLITRPMTWCDLIYMAAVEVTKDKCVLITRYPMDTYFNQFPTRIHVSSTKDTIPMIVHDTFYKFYPDIKESDIGINTTNKFIDTLNISNAYLGPIDGDYDGDQVSCKAIFSVEATDELCKQIDSKRHFVSVGVENEMKTTKEGAQALHDLTYILYDDAAKLTNPEF